MRGKTTHPAVPKSASSAGCCLYESVAECFDVSTRTVRRWIKADDVINLEAVDYAGRSLGLFESVPAEADVLMQRVRS